MHSPLSVLLRELHLLEPGADEALDRLSRLAATVLNVPVALMSFPDGEGLFFKSFVGLPEPFVTPRRAEPGVGLSERVLRNGEVLILNDARAVEDVCALPLVRDLGVVAYLGAPLSIPGHGAVGVLAVYDSAPRAWSAPEVGILRDLAASVVTEIEWRRALVARARTREVLRESEVMHRALVDAWPDLLFRMARDGTYLEVRAGHDGDLVAPPQQLTGRRIRDVLSAEVAGAITAGIERALDTRAVQPIEYALDIGGEERHFEARAVAVSADEAMVIVRNITERKRAETELRRQALLFRSLHDAVLVTDPQGRIVDWNPAAERLWGYTRDEILGQDPAVLHAAALGHSLEDQIRATLDRVGRWVGELPFRRKDGSEGVAEAVVNAQYDEQGRMVCRVGVNRDVTERQALEEQLRQAQKMEAIGRLAGGVAHDFNNILTAIRGNTEILLLDAEEGSTTYEDLEEIRRAADRAASLTHQLVAFSRRQVLKPRVLDLNVVLADMEMMLNRLIGEHIEFRVVRAPTLATVRADPGQLEQVILNLVVNARDAMPHGGTLVLEALELQLDAAAGRRYGGVEPGCYVVLAVSDTGVGVSPEIRERLFEPFFTTKEVGKGTGLGLSTVYGIVQQSGGQVAVESELGQGATFRIFLPRLEEAPALTPAVAPHAVPALRGAETVLLVEDEDAVRLLARRILRRHGFTVIEAANGAEALRLAGEYPDEIHLLLTDVVMPGMSGPELARQLAASRPGLRMLFMSGYTDEAIVHHGVRDVGVALLEKPFSADALVNSLAEVLATM